MMELADLMNGEVGATVIQPPTWAYLANILLVVILAFLLERVYFYARGNIAEGRRSMSNQFLIVAVGTFLIIATIQTSLIAALGLLGVLSLIRFRSKTKESEDLLYLFLALAIGLGIGAGQPLLTTTGVVVLSMILAIRNHNRVPYTVQQIDSVNLRVTVWDPEAVQLNDLMIALNDHASSVKMKKVDSSEEKLEATFNVSYKTLDEVVQSSRALNQLHNSVQVSFNKASGILA